MGSLRCEVCLGEEGQASPLMAPLLHKHLGLLVCRQVLSCAACSQLMHLWDHFSARARINLAISHPTALTVPPHAAEAVTARVAAMLGSNWGQSVDMSLAASAATQNREDSPEVFGCVEATVQPSQPEEDPPDNQVTVKEEPPVELLECSDCPRTFLQVEELVNHARLRHDTPSPTSTDMQLCPKCNLKFSRPQYLLFHVMQYHAEQRNGKFSCLFCPQQVRTRTSLQYHVRKHLGQSFYLKCSLCPKHLSSKHALEYHIQSQHSDIPETKVKFDKMQFSFICPFCYKGLSSKTNLEFHIKACREGSKYHIKVESLDVLEFTCEFCYRVLASEEKLQHHFYRCHHDAQGRFTNTDTSFATVPCAECGTKLASEMFLSYHVRRWHGQEHASVKKKHSKQCQFCKRVLSSNQMLRYHIQNQHCKIKSKPGKMSKNSLPYTCNFCQRTICSKQGLQKHILNYHSGSAQDSKFPCPFCSNGFDSKVGLVQHLRHHPPTPGTSSKEEPSEATSRKAPKLKISNFAGSLSSYFSEPSSEETVGLGMLASYAEICGDVGVPKIRVKSCRDLIGIGTGETTPKSQGVGKKQTKTRSKPSIEDIVEAMQAGAASVGCQDILGIGKRQTRTKASGSKVQSMNCQDIIGIGKRQTRTQAGGSEKETGVLVKSCQDIIGIGKRQSRSQASSSKTCQDIIGVGNKRQTRAQASSAESSSSMDVVGVGKRQAAEVQTGSARKKICKQSSIDMLAEACSEVVRNSEMEEAANPTNWTNSDEDYKCSFCEEQLSSKFELERHMTHTHVKTEQNVL